MSIPERMTVIDAFIHGRNLPGSRIITVQLNVVLVQFDELTSVSADGQAAVGLYKPMNENRTFLTRPAKMLCLISNTLTLSIGLSPFMKKIFLINSVSSVFLAVNYSFLTCVIPF